MAAASSTNNTINSNTTQSTPSISFDSFSKLRILPSAIYDSSENLSGESRDFINSLQSFWTGVGEFYEGVSAKAALVEQEKLKTIGLRLLVEREAETREASISRLDFYIVQRQAELDRLQSQLESLEAVKRTQIAFKETLNK